MVAVLHFVCYIIPNRVITMLVTSNCNCFDTPVDM
jgi:hypothetical protein